MYREVGFGIGRGGVVEYSTARVLRFVDGGDWRLGLGDSYGTDVSYHLSII